mgnify:CR=1 FL=1
MTARNAGRRAGRALDHEHALARDCEIVDSEIEHSVILEESKIFDISRIADSLIGKQVEPVKLPERAWRWCRRQPVLATLLATTALLLVLVPVVATVGYVQAKRQWHAAQRAQERAERAEHDEHRQDDQAQSTLQPVRLRRRLRLDGFGWSGRCRRSPGLAGLGPTRPPGRP